MGNTCLKLLYITNSRIPTQKAHGVQIVKMCEAFIESGVKLQLVIPKRVNSIKVSIKDYYGLRIEIPLISLWTLDFLEINRKLKIKVLDLLFYSLETITYYLGVSFLTIKNRDLIFTRDHYSPLFCFYRNRIIWEVHELPKFKFGRLLVLFLARRCKLIIAVNRAVEMFFREHGFNNEKLVYLQNGVDGELYTAKGLLKVQKEKSIGYTGSLYERKGVYSLIEAMEYVDNSCRLVIYGGPGTQRENILSFIKTKNLENKITVFPTVPYKEVPEILLGMDVLVLPNSNKDVLSSSQTSPLKLAEYLASGKPLVISDVPATLGIDKENEGIFVFKADDPVDLAKKIKLALLSNNKLLKRSFLTLRQRTKIVLSRFWV